MEIIKNTDYWVDNIKYYYYEDNHGYSGSYQGMRYRIATNWSEQGIFVNLFDKKNKEYLKNAILVTSIWPEPFCYDYMRKNKIMTVETVEFPFTDEGLEEARVWINSKYDERRQEFEEARRH